MRKFLLILSFTLGLTTAAQAGFVNNKSTWDSLSWEVKQGYAMGQFDELVMVLTSDGAKETKRKDGLNECAIRIKLTAKDMVQIIDKEYEDLAAWQFPPLFVKGLCTVCKPVCD